MQQEGVAVDGEMNFQKKAEDLWRAGYRCALVPDTTIEDGRLVSTQK